MLNTPQCHMAYACRRNIPVASSATPQALHTQPFRKSHEEAKAGTATESSALLASRRYVNSMMHLLAHTARNHHPSCPRTGSDDPQVVSTGACMHVHGFVHSKRHAATLFLCNPRQTFTLCRQPSIWLKHQAVGEAHAHTVTRRLPSCSGLALGLTAQGRESPVAQQAAELHI